MTEKEQISGKQACFGCCWLLLWVLAGCLWISGMAIDEIAVASEDGCNLYCGYKKFKVRNCGSFSKNWHGTSKKIGQTWFGLSLSGGVIYFSGWLAVLATCFKKLKLTFSAAYNTFVIFISGVLWLVAIISYASTKGSCLGPSNSDYKVGKSWDLIFTACVINLFMTSVFCWFRYCTKKGTEAGYEALLGGYDTNTKKAVLNVLICMKFGFEFATSENRQKTMNKLRYRQCGGQTAMRDAVKSGLYCMRGLKEVMNELNVLNYKFIHIVLTDGQDTSSKTTLYDLTNMSMEMNRLFAQDIQTIFIGVNLGHKEQYELNQLSNVINNESLDTVSVHNCDSMNVGNVFNRIQIQLGLAQQNIVVTDGTQGLLYQRNQLSVRVDGNTSLLVLFTLDISGSMSGGRWNRVKQAVENFLSRLRSTDLYSVILFNDKVDIITGNPEIMNL